MPFNGSSNPVNAQLLKSLSLKLKNSKCAKVLQALRHEDENSH